MATYQFSNLPDFIKAEMSINQMVQYLIRSKSDVSNFITVSYSLYKYSKTLLFYYAKVIIQ